VIDGGEHGHLLAQGKWGLTRVSNSIRPVEAQVPEAAGNARRAQADQIVLAERGAPGVEHVADLRRVPARAPELDRVPQAVPGESFQEARGSTVEKMRA